MKTSNSGLSNELDDIEQKIFENYEYKNTYDEIIQEIEEKRDKELIEELKHLGVKYSEENIVFVVKDRNNQLLWLETGNKMAGLNHIIERHKDDFKKIGNINENEIPKLIKRVVSKNEIVSEKVLLVNGRKGIEKKYTYNDKYLVLVAIGMNGFIVSAYFRDK